VADEDASGNKRLVAYAVATHQPGASTGELRDHLKQTLTEYMVPSLFVQIEALPLTPNGKVNRKALPKPEVQTAAAGDTSAEPHTDAEILLSQIWGEVLGLAQVGVRDNFFDLGGHSLMITRILSRLRESLQIDLPMKSIFEAPTITEFALLVESAVAEQINSLTDEEVQKMDETMAASVTV